MAAADAFISPSPLTQTTKYAGGCHATTTTAAFPRTTAASNRLGQNHRIAPWSTSALEMSGGGGGGGEVVSAEGTSTIPDEVFNLVKSIVGAGVLSLPAGAFDFYQY